jgi:hypothetical protein
VPRALLGHEDKVGRTGPLSAQSLREGPGEEQRRVRESHKEAMTFVDDGPEDRDGARQVVAIAEL